MNQKIVASEEYPDALSRPEFFDPRIENHIMVNARQCPSDNFDARPDGNEINTLVIHAISLPPGEFAESAICDFFCNNLDCSTHAYYQQIEGVTVSAHLLISREGKVTQFVPFAQRAWHAGASFFDGKSRVNDFSIGIELIGDDETPFTDLQYAVLARVAKQLTLTYPALTQDRIVGHADIAPERKTDPGPHFDWNRFLVELEYAL